jgi:hypothetical protein
MYLSNAPLKTSVLPSRKTRLQYNDQPVRSVKCKAVAVPGRAGRHADVWWRGGTPLLYLNVGTSIAHYICPGPV